MRYLVQSYSTGRSHRLAYIPDRLGVSDVKCRVYPPSGGENEQQQLVPLEPLLFTMDYRFRQLGDYFFVIEADGSVDTILKATVEK